MTRHCLALLLAIALAPPIATAAPGDPQPARPGRTRTFDPATVTSVSGRVEEVRRYDGRRNAGMHVALKTSDGVIDVHLGPVQFLESRGLSIAKGDELAVTGSKVPMGGEPAVIAQEVTKGATTVTLRDANGVPAWARRGGRR